ncbi:MAG: sugar transferase [Bacillota bacterium]
MKRLVDLLCAFVGLIVLFPVIILVSLVVLIDSGRPILFIQERIGLHGRLFNCYKFRTMKTGAAMLFNDDGSTLVSKYDPRVTRVGRLLRRFHIDELPQLWNIILGQMSLVGPRPDLPHFWGVYDSAQRRRFTVKPGMTGLAQINQRNAPTVDERVSYDLEYVTGYSLWLDLKILLKTLAVILDGSSAHDGYMNRESGSEGYRGM